MVPFKIAKLKICVICSEITAGRKLEKKWANLSLSVAFFESMARRASVTTLGDGMEDKLRCTVTVCTEPPSLRNIFAELAAPIHLSS